MKVNDGDSATLCLVEYCSVKLKVFFSREYEE